MKILNQSLFSILAQQALSLPKTVLQVGASAGQEIDEFWSEGIRAGIFLEPLDIPFEILTQRCEGKPNFLPLQALALSKDNTEADFFIASNGGQSSSILEPNKHLNYYPHVSFKDSIKLKGYQVDTLTTIARQSNRGLPAVYDLFFLDVQGAELEVMKGASNQLLHGRYIYSEVCDGDGYKGDVRLTDLLIFLRSFGYKAIALELDSKKGYGNCLWSREHDLG
jgi:FkbM family methyltransferase